MQRAAGIKRVIIVMSTHSPASRTKNATFVHENDPTLRVATNLPRNYKIHHDS
jgi:hypothetical protein